MPSVSTGRAVVDTNVLFYAEDVGAGAKHARATAVIEELGEANELVVSTQILQEFYATVTRKLRLAPERVYAQVERYAQFEVVIVRPELVLAAIDLHRLRSISFWDALVVKAASVAGCRRVLSEDMQHGQVLDGVRIENPFLATRAHEPKRTYGRRTGRR